MMTTEEMEKLIDSIAKHKLNNHLSNIWFDASGFKTDLLLMKKDISFIEKETGEIKDLLLQFIMKVETKYVTKEEAHEKYKFFSSKFDKIDKIFLWFISVIWLAVIWAILNLVIIQS